MGDLILYLESMADVVAVFLAFGFVVTAGLFIAAVLLWRLFWRVLETLWG